MLKWVPHSEPIDFTGWTFFGDERLDKLIAEVCAEVISSTLMPEDNDEHTAPYAFLPWEWIKEDGIGGAAPDDPLTVYVRLPLGSTDEHPTFSFSLNECIDGVIELHEGLDGKIHGDAANVIAIRDALRAAAQRLDDALAETAADKA